MQFTLWHSLATEEFNLSNSQRTGFVAWFVTVTAEITFHMALIHALYTHNYVTECIDT